MNQNKNIKIYSIQKTYTIGHKVTSYANSTSLFTAYDTKFVDGESKTIQAHRRHYKDRYETI